MLMAGIGVMVIFAGMAGYMLYRSFQPAPEKPKKKKNRLSVRDWYHIITKDAPPVVSLQQHLLNARAAYAREDDDGVIASASAMLAIHPRYLEAFRLRSHAYARQKQYAAALTDINLVLRYSVHPAFLLHRMFIALHLKLYELLLEDARAVMTAGCVDPHVYEYCAHAYARLGDYDAALDNIEQAMAVADKPEARYHNGRGWYLAHLGYFAEALDDFAQALKIDPTLFYTYGSRGHAYFLMSSYPEALADFTTALDLKSDHDFALAGLAITHYAAGHIEAAQNTWRKLMALDARYQKADALGDEYDLADAFVETARELVASLSD